MTAHHRQAHTKPQQGLMLLLWLCVLGISSLNAQETRRYPQKTVTFHTAEDFARLTKGRVKLHRRTNCTNCELRIAKESLPIHQVSFLVREPDDAIDWIVLPEGIVRHNVFSSLHLITGRTTIQTGDSPTLIQYFHGRRWLMDNKVTGVGFEAGSNDRNIVWIETPKGFSRIEYKEMTLADKARHFEARVRARHVRHGLTADSLLLVPGDLSSNKTVSSDNDGLWTAMYVAAECFRYKVTGEAEAREFARQGMQALIRLEAITGIPGFPARSFIKIGEDIQPQDGEWHTTPDGQWRWKGDTSSDEIVGHYFVWPIYYDLVADENEKRQISALSDRVTTHILDNNYQLIDVDGKRTRWGFWGPDEIWNDPDETGLRALHILAHLRVAMHLTVDAQKRARYQAAYDELMTKHRYHLLTRNQKIMVPGHINHSDDELAFLSYYPLLRYETDAKLREVYLQSLERSWQIERPERNPLWNFIYAVGSGSQDFDRAEAVLTLRQIPMELIEWTVTNSHRLDVAFDPMNDRFKRRQSLIVLPYDELPMTKWNGNPYNLDGGNGGRSEDDGAYFLLPYWMGRYHKLIGE
ncbi:MAG TPA: hypothetical protein VNQ79_12575 [Blastocatellia bacterium]|nr:hypothetical protein [Blastocatellia bacterium]